MAGAAMWRLGAVVMAAALLGLASSLGPAPVSAAAAPPPKVVIVVGPVGSLTDMYRAAAADGARAARRHDAQVITIYSPDATWPVVRDALQGASIVVYLGHGNGWPSRYSSVLQPTTQDGLGLNPAAGGDDEAHQYFGESYLARDVHLAPHALVLLHHLCYASGNSEPGLPEGTLDVARQRVDDYAAGWLAAGADAVLVDAFFGPAWYIDAALGGDGTIDAAWRSAPDYHDHVIAFPSRRTPGTTVTLDPDHVRHGFHRSLAGRGSLSMAQIRGGTRAAPGGGVAGGGVAVRGATGGSGGSPGKAGGGSTGGGTTPGVQSPAALGASVGLPDLVATSDLLVAGGVATLRVPVALPAGAALPPGTSLGVRWVPLVLDNPSVPADPAGGETAGATPPATPRIDATAPEAPGDIVTAETTLASDGTLSANVALPPEPGLYRLVPTLHDATGVAFDAATQALIAPMVVRVAGRVSVAFAVPSALSVAAGARTTIAVRVANDGSEPWTSAPPWDIVRPTAFVTATWVPLGMAVDTTADMTGAEVDIDPGRQAVVGVPLIAPRTPGSYMLLLDVLSPTYGSLTSRGVPPATVLVTVTPAPLSPELHSSGGPHR